MHLFARARVPLACLSTALPAPRPGDPRIEPWTECDILVSGRRIEAVIPHASSRFANASVTDLGGVLVWPGWIDAHTHLDKTLTWSRAPNPTGEFWDAGRALGADKHNWTEEDIHRRASRALERAWAHGTIAMRTHVDTGPDGDSVAHAVMGRLRGEWAGRIALQTVSLCSLDAFTEGKSSGIMTVTARHGVTALGGFPQPNPQLPRQLDNLMAAARELGVGLDLHVDESALAAAECLRATAEAVLRNAFPHPVVCGHACSLAVQEDARARETIARVKAAGIGIVSLPLCNLYLQGRIRGAAGAPGTPRWRGVTLLHEWIEAEVPVACASDNVRDAFHAWGDYDMLEVYRESVRIAHLDTRMEASAALVTRNAAAIMGLPGYGCVAAGSPADLVVTSARTFNELLSRPGAPRRLIRGEGFREPIPPPDLN